MPLGMQVVKLWKVPESVLTHFRQTSFPTALDGGHVAQIAHALSRKPSGQQASFSGLPAGTWATGPVVLL